MLELRLMAYLAGVTLLIERMESHDRDPLGSDDIHTLNTKALFDGRYDDALRTLAKNFFYALQYGGSEGAIQQALAKKGEYLEQSYIRELMLRVFREYPEMAAWQQARAAHVARCDRDLLPRIARNAYGRCRVLLAQDPLKEWLSHEVQGTAADTVSFGLLRLAKEAPAAWAHLVLSIHDANMGYSPTGMVEQDVAATREQMERPCWISNRMVVLPTDVKRGVVWSRMK
jgi:DNA polymerase I-like protein with 3'-5' exonuclease and polymerase domains